MNRGKKNSSNKLSHPILEFAPAREAMIEPSRVFQPRDVPEHCVICFFREVIEKIASEKQAKIAATHHWEDGPHHLYEIEQDRKSTRLNSSHQLISYAVFCLKKK